MTTEYEGKTLWNSSSVSSEVIPQGFDVSKEISEDELFANNENLNAGESAQAYETRFDESSLADVIL